VKGEHSFVTNLITHCECLLPKVCIQFQYTNSIVSGEMFVKCI